MVSPSKWDLSTLTDSPGCQPKVFVSIVHLRAFQRTVPESGIKLGIFCMQSRSTILKLQPMSDSPGCYKIGDVIVDGWPLWGWSRLPWKEGREQMQYTNKLKWKTISWYNSQVDTNNPHVKRSVFKVFREQGCTLVLPFRPAAGVNCTQSPPPSPLFIHPHPLYL